MVTFFRVPAFIVTLALMMIARGLAFIIAVRYQSWLAGGTTEGTPEAVTIAAPSFDWLGNGELLGIPNPILLMIVLYVLAHVVMTRTSLGRYIYAVGGNPEAARLSGVPVFGVLILVYALCGAMAGLAASWTPRDSEAAGPTRANCTNCRSSPPWSWAGPAWPAARAASSAR